MTSSMPMILARAKPNRLKGLWATVRWPLAVTALVVLILIVWEYLQSSVELWNPSFLPPPSQVWRAFVHEAQTGVLTDSLAYSGFNVAVGFTIAAVAGVLSGLLLGTSKFVYDAGGGLFWTLYSTPRIAFQPLLVLWMGFGVGPKILVIFLLAFFPIAINTMDGIRGVDKSLMRAAQVYGASRSEIFFKVQLWEALPLILTGLRMGIARSMIGIVVGEFIGGSRGLGYLILHRSGDLHLDSAIAITIMLVVLAIVGMGLINLLRRIVAPWYVEGAAKS